MFTLSVGFRLEEEVAIKADLENDFVIHKKVLCIFSCCIFIQPLINGVFSELQALNTLHIVNT